MYQALYRVWRPKTFSDMVGQENIVKTLRNQIRSGHIAHAYLFCGSRGTGKTSAAKIMARAVNCLTPADGDPCGECESCRAILNDASLDVYEMDAASNSKVDEIRDLLEKVEYPPQFSKYKVYIIDEVHMLSTSAFNALLKTLEEPPSYMVFILATTEPQKIPSTILSRCQRFDFGRFTETELTGRMKTILSSMKREADDQALELIASAAEGGMRDALSILDMSLSGEERITEERVRQVLGSADKGFLFSFADALADYDCAAALKNCREVMLSGRDTGIFLKDVGMHLRALTTVKLCGTDAVSDGERYAEQASRFSVTRLLRLSEEFLKAQSDTRWASSAGSVLELCTLKCCQRAAGEDNSTLIERLSELENKLKELEENGVRVASPKKKMTVVPENASEAEASVEEAPAPDDSIPSSDKTPKEIWNDMLKQLKKTEPSLFGIINACTYGGFKDNTFTAIFKEDKIGMLCLLTDTNKAKVRDMLDACGANHCSFEASGPKQTGAAKKREETAQHDISVLSEVFGRDKLIIE